MCASESNLVHHHAFYVHRALFDQAAIDLRALERRHSRHAVFVINISARHRTAGAHKLYLVCCWNVNAKLILSIDEFVLDVRSNLDIKSKIWYPHQYEKRKQSW